LAKLILAEPEPGASVLPEWVLDEAAITIGTQIETAPLIQVVADKFTVRILETLKDLLHLQQMIAIVVELVDFHRLHRGFDLQLDNVTEIFLGIDYPLAAVARVMDHHSESLCEAREVADEAPFPSESLEAVVILIGRRAAPQAVSSFFFQVAAHKIRMCRSVSPEVAAHGVRCGRSNAATFAVAGLFSPLRTTAT
jgi:hypothetical protein